MFSSRCGVDCEACVRKEQVHCDGCAHMTAPFWGGICEVKHCCEEKGLDHCGLCARFPCETLAQMGVEQGFDPAPRLERLTIWAKEN